MNGTQIQPGWLSIPDAATYTGFSITAIRTAIDTNRFPVRRVEIARGSAKPSVRIKREHLDAWIEGKEIIP